MRLADGLIDEVSQGIKDTTIKKKFRIVVTKMVFKLLKRDVSLNIVTNAFRMFFHIIFIPRIISAIFDS